MMVAIKRRGCYLDLVRNGWLVVVGDAMDERVTIGGEAEEDFSHV